MRHLALILCLATSTYATTIDAGKHPTLQSAFDALPETGGVVRIPPGNYEITEPLRIKTPETRIEGSGAATHIINKNETGSHALVLAPANFETDKKARLWRVQVADLRLSGNPKSGDGIHAVGIQEIYLHGVSADHHGACGFNLIDCYEDPRVSDNILTYNATVGLRIVGGHDIVVSANHFEENQDALHCIDAFNLCATGNNIDDHLRHGIVIENTYGSVVSGNMIEECNGTAVILRRDAYGITLSSNVIAHHLEGGIDLDDAWGCSISANTFVLVHKFGIRVTNGGRHAITGNTFGNSYIGAGAVKRVPKNDDPMQLDAQGGVVLQAAESITLTGNSFSGTDAEALSISDDSQQILFSSNTLTDCARKAPAGTKWIKQGTAKNVLIKDNLGLPAE